MKIDDKVVLCEVMPVHVTVEHGYHLTPEITVEFVLKRVCNDVYFIEKEIQGNKKYWSEEE